MYERKTWNIVASLAGCLAMLAMAGTGMADEARVVTVGGHGETEAVPDRAQVTMGVEARNVDQGTAQREVEQVAEAFLNTCRKLGIAKEHVKSSGLQVRPEYDWDQKTRERRLRGYLVTRQLEVDLRDLNLLGELMQRATASGVNQVSPPNLFSSRKDDLRREALANAAADAKRNADTLARALDARVGDVRRIVTSDVVVAPPPIRPMMEARAMKAGAGAETYETGQIKITADITVDFDLIVN